MAAQCLSDTGSLDKFWSSIEQTFCAFKLEKN